jgi:putative transposase
MYDRLRMENFPLINHKRLYRLNRLARLNSRRRTRRRLAQPVRAPLVRPIRPNVLRSMDFMRDTLINGQPFRSFNVMDEYNREALHITIAKRIPATRVIAELTQVIRWRGKPQAMRVDNGPEFLAEALRSWCQQPEHQIELTYIQTGKPFQNGSLELLNRTFREDVLSAYLLDNLGQAQQYAYQWIWVYNHDRPHQTLLGLTPR